MSHRYRFLPALSKLVVALVVLGVGLSLALRNWEPWTFTAKPGGDGRLLLGALLSWCSGGAVGLYLEDLVVALAASNSKRTMLSEALNHLVWGYALTATFPLSLAVGIGVTVSNSQPWSLEPKQGAEYTRFLGISMMAVGGCGSFVIVERSRLIRRLRDWWAKWRARRTMPRSWRTELDRLDVLARDLESLMRDLGHTEQEMAESLQRADALRAEFERGGVNLTKSEWFALSPAQRAIREPHEAETMRSAAISVYAMMGRTLPGREQHGPSWQAKARERVGILYEVEVGIKGAPLTPEEEQAFWQIQVALDEELRQNGTFLSPDDWWRLQPEQRALRQRWDAAQARIAAWRGWPQEPEDERTILAEMRAAAIARASTYLSADQVERLLG